MTTINSRSTSNLKMQLATDDEQFAKIRLQIVSLMHRGWAPEAIFAHIEAFIVAIPAEGIARGYYSYCKEDEKREEKV